MHIRKYIYLVLITLMLTNCSKFDSPSDLVDKSILFSDPDKKWENAAIGIEIREPRPQNPDRYSKVIINIPLEYFELTRNRGENTSSHIVTKSGANMILINGDDDYDNALLEEYGLSSEKNIKYKRYYEFLYGLPHSLKSDYVKELSNIEETNFNNQEAFALTAKLRKPIISNEWKIYFSKENHSILGLDVIHKDENKGETILFENYKYVSDVKIPLKHYWVNTKTKEELGTDLVVYDLFKKKELK